MFRRGTWMSKTLNYLTATPAYVVDNSRYEQGEVEAGLRVYAPNRLLEETKDIFVIITTSAFYEVVEQLLGFGLIAGQHFCVSPSLKDFSAISNLTTNSQTIYIACSDKYLEDNAERGGGFYEYSTETRELKKLINGLCHSITEGITVSTLLMILLELGCWMTIFRPPI